MALPLMLGICLSWYFREWICDYWCISLAVSLVTLLGMFVYGRKRLSPFSYGFAVYQWVFFFFLGITLLLRYYNSVQITWNSSPAFYKGIVTEEPRSHSLSRTYAVTLLEERDSCGWKQRKANIYLSISSSSPDEFPAVGDAVIFYGKINKPQNRGNPYEFDYASWLLKKGISGVVYSGNNYSRCSKIIGDRLLCQLDNWTRLKIAASKIRRNLVGKYISAGIEGEELGILSALTLGDRLHLSKEVQTLFSQSGVSHVLALSGLHLGILVAFLLFLLSPMLRYGRSRWLAVIVCWLFIWMFTLLTGFSVSLQRAAVMYTLFLLFFAQRRQGISLNNLAWAAVVLLLFHPVSLLEIGFQLSFLSVFFILFLYPLYMDVRSRIKRRWIIWMTDFLYVSLSAQIATAPLVAYIFHTLPVTFLLANMIVIPSAYFLLITAFLFFLLVPFNWGVSFVGSCMAGEISWMQGILTKLNALPYSSFEVYPSLWTVGAGYLLVFSIIWLWDRRSSRVMKITIAAFSLFVAGLLADACFNKVSPQIVFYNMSSCPAVHFISSSQESAVWSSSPSKAQEKLETVAYVFWKREKIKSPMYFTADCHMPYLACHNDIVSFRGRRVALVAGNTWKRKVSSAIMPVDVLYISRGCYTSLDELTRLFSPRLLVLDSSLSRKKRLEYTKEAHALHITCHDMREKGALVLPCRG